jgi:hypothetical protein
MSASVAVLRGLVREAVAPLPGENVKAALWRVSEAMGVSRRSVEEWYRGRAAARPEEVAFYCERAAAAARQRLEKADEQARALQARLRQAGCGL